MAFERALYRVAVGHRAIALSLKVVDLVGLDVGEAAQVGQARLDRRCLLERRGAIRHSTSFALREGHAVGFEPLVGRFHVGPGALLGDRESPRPKVCRCSLHVRRRLWQRDRARVGIQSRRGTSLRPTIPS